MNPNAYAAQQENAAAKYAAKFVDAGASGGSQVKRVEQLCGLLGSSTVRLQELTTRLSSLADRIVGSIPTDAQKASSTLSGGGGGLESHLNATGTHIMSLLAECEEHVRRIEEFI